MIVSYNICEQCGNQTEIQSGSIKSGIQVEFSIYPVYELKKMRYGFEHQKTFCDQECFLEYIKSKFDTYGKMKET